VVKQKKSSTYLKLLNSTEKIKGSKGKNRIMILKEELKVNTQKRNKDYELNKILRLNEKNTIS